MTTYDYILLKRENADIERVSDLDGRSRKSIKHKSKIIKERIPSLDGDESVLERSITGLREETTAKK